MDRKTLWFMLAVVAVTVAMVFAGCSGDDSNETAESGQQTAFLSASQVTAGSNSLATGTATVTYANLESNVPQDREVRVQLVTEGLVNVTTAQLRLGLPGATGPVLWTLFTRTNANPNMPTNFTTVIRGNQWLPAGGINTFDEFVSALRSGQVYVQINTTANPNGAIRGQIGATRLELTLRGQPISTLTPTAVVTLDQVRQRVRLQMPDVGIPNATAVRFVYGGLGGARLMTFREQNAGPLPVLDVTKGAGDVQSQPSLGITNFPELLSAIYAQKVYLVVFTSTFPGGEYRALVAPDGHILPQIFTVSMNPNNTFTPASIDVESGSIVQFRNDSAGALRVVSDPANRVAGGPNSNIDFPNGIGAGQIYQWQIPLGTPINTLFFYHEPNKGTAGNGSSVGTGMAGGIKVI